MQVLTQAMTACSQQSAYTESEMPMDACLYIFKCPSWEVLLPEHLKDCCAFWSGDNVKCPPVQRQHQGGVRS